MTGYIGVYFVTSNNCANMALTQPNGSTTAWSNTASSYDGILSVNSLVKGVRFRPSTNLGWMMFGLANNGFAGNANADYSDIGMF